MSMQHKFFLETIQMLGVTFLFENLKNIKSVQLATMTPHCGGEAFIMLQFALSGSDSYGWGAMDDPCDNLQSNRVMIIINCPVHRAGFRGGNNDGWMIHVIICVDKPCIEYNELSCTQGRIPWREKMMDCSHPELLNKVLDKLVQLSVNTSQGYRGRGSDL